MAPTYKALKDEYTHLWSVMRPKLPLKVVKAQTDRIRAHRDSYDFIEKSTSIPWAFVGIVHMMEGNCSFRTHLHNGDALTARTRNVPAGRPKAGKPPFTWEESALDALKMKNLHLIGADGWCVERMAYEFERYNGWGYRLYHPDTRSPYLWSGSNLYTRGKYVADGKWSATAVSSQIGAMVLLRELIGDE